MKKFLFVVSILVLTSLSVFSEEWKMCLGSFSDYSKAERQVKTLTENGIEEQGSHDELIKKNGIYAGLYEMYSN